MGCWSVYCNISQIAITAGQQCVLIPLKNSEGMAYMPYLPATLPIFGKYDDYGGIEEIEKNENTDLIESHFDCTIDDFAYFFTRGCISPKDTSKGLRKNEEIKDWTFMFVDRKVYDFMANHVPKGYGGKGHFQFGEESILKLIGFNYIGKFENNPIGDPKRYQHKWELQGKYFYSDGWSFQCGNESIFNFHDAGYNNLSDHITIPEDKMWIGDKAMWQLWEHLDDNLAKKQLLGVIGRDRALNDDYMDDFHDRMDKLLIESGETPPPRFKPEPKTIMDKYVRNFRTYGKTLCELTTIHHNFRPMSGHFAPHQLYLTPQCGELESHQILLDKFAEINKSYIALYED